MQGRGSVSMAKRFQYQEVREYASSAKGSSMVGCDFPLPLIGTRPYDEIHGHLVARSSMFFQVLHVYVISNDLDIAKRSRY